MAHRGNFFVIEGTDGSGKGTQFRLLTERLQQAGYDVATFDFPRYEEDSSYFVRQYLNGAYGSADEVGPYTGSLFFSLDRYQAAPAIREALDAGKIVLANRFTGSNMAHQGTKFANTEQRRGYFIWLDNLEFQMLGIPRPDLNVVLRVPAEIAQSLVDKKEKRSYTDKKRDIHEADLSHLQRSVEVYDDLCNLFPKDFSRIDCVRSDKLLSIEAVEKLLWEKLQPLLPAPPEVRPTIAPDTDQPEKTQTIPAASTDTQQLVLTASTVTASQLKQHLGNNLIQAPLLPHYDTTRNNHGQFNYYIPSHLDPTTKNLYCETLDGIYELHDEIVEGLVKHLAVDEHQQDTTRLTVQAQHIAQAVLPSATQTSLIWQGATGTAEAAIATLLQSAASEIQTLTQTALTQLGEHTPDILARVNARIQMQTSHTESTRLEELASSLLASDYAADGGKTIDLVEATPRNELDLAATILYEYSDESLQAIRTQLAKLPYAAKLEVLETYLNQPAGTHRTALRHAKYTFDTLSDLDTLYAFQNVLPSASTSRQGLSPRFGYKVPELIEEADLVEQFQTCFDMSLSLHSKLQQAGHTADAHYAVLLGHRLRWQISYNANEALTLYEAAHSSVLSSTLNGLVQAMLEKIAETHPIIGELQDK